MSLVEMLRRRMAAAAAGPFRHAPYPLLNSLRYPGDPGLFGPGSVSWKVVGDVTAMLGGIRALLIQAAHPEVVAGVADHSLYRQDPLGRLSRTSAYVTATTFGATPEVEEAVERVRRAHRRVVGRSHRDLPYTADEPGLSAWVHNALTDSFLVAYQRFGPDRLTRQEADTFVAEQARIGRLLDADPLPETAEELATWIRSHPEIAPSPGMQDAVDFLTDPPLHGLGVKFGYRILQAGAVETIPTSIQKVLGVSSPPGAETVAGAMMRLLRWTLGPSPSWFLALVRTGSEVPEGFFKEMPPVEATRIADRPA